MKTFMENVLEWKTYASMVFAGSMILCVFIMIVLGESTVPIPVIISILVVSCAGSFLQYLAFTDRIIKNMRYSIRILIFAIPFFTMLAANAYFFNWFILDTIHWLAFTIVFILVFAVMIFGFEIYYHVMGKKYDGLLGQYRKQRESGNK